MSTGRDPWSDPATQTEQGAPYAGPPVTSPPASGWAAPGYGLPGYALPGYGPPGSPPWGYPPVGYGQPPWPVAPRGPRRPGQVVASAVLAFVQSALVMIASLYVWFFASILEVATAGAPSVLDAEGLATEGTVLAVVQLVSAVFLVAAGVLALNRRTRGTWQALVAAHAVQIVLSLYWLVRLLTLTGELPGAEGDAVVVSFALFFAAGPLVGLGLLLAPAARRWFTPETAPGGSPG